ncbi:septal ring lytic transglycosylase RlpA family protein [Pedobacter nyackensis]|uniref:septal ring lytic transglycosylase RlpA family protein n=1 Tax=Pedobacter nyackensis TaxID=475255 RepID=UPI00292EC4F4|nr:septal ring lytic transglycosylase RlpA family protein [Pedobacter nyackensis]
MKYCLLMCGMLISFLGFAQDIPDVPTLGGTADKVAESSSDHSSKLISKTVYATYYHRKFEGRKTTSGVRYRRNKMTAAHMRLPFGTIVTVTNPANGESVDVEVNDRGPHSRKFKIDLSEAAAKAIGIYGKGVAKVEISYIPDED